MPKPVLHDLFADMVPGCYRASDVRDRDIIAYVTDLLARFVSAAALYPVDSGGRVLEDVGEMLIQADPILGTASSFEEERTIHQQVGDAALFFTGMFPESATYRRSHHYRLQSTSELIQAGKHSYYVVSQFNVFEHAAQAPLFRKLSRDFEHCVEGLHRVRQELTSLHVH
jgi:hypothetical protein